MGEHRVVRAAEVLAAERERRRQLSLDLTAEREAICTEAGVPEHRARQIAACEACRAMEPDAPCSCGLHPPPEAA